MAYALGQIFVVSDESNALVNATEGLAHYHDTLLERNFGNFRELLEAVTYHPCMAAYLTYLRNEKGTADGTRRPDENYAREIMQLFTIGLWELGPDGTRRLEHGRPVPTYTNDDIRELARVFTGLSFPRKEAEKGGFKWGHTDWTARLVAYPQFHDDGEKRLLGGRKVLPAGQGADKDIADALDLLFEHPNTGPFVARLLIQRFTTSNPSRGYVWRVAGVFADNGQGVRGT